MRKTFKTQAPKRSFLYLAYAGLCFAVYIQISLQEALFSSAFGASTFILGAIFIVPIIYLIYRARLFKDYPIQKIYFRNNYLILPKCLGKKRYVKIKYSDIEAFDLRGKDELAFYCIQTPKNTFHLSKDIFIEVDAWSEFADTLTAKIESLDNAEEQLYKFRKQQELSKDIFSGFQPATLIVCLLVTFAFVAEVASYNLQAHHLISIGAANTKLFFSGDYFRLLSASVLHASYLHFLCNIVILFAFAYILEGLCGPAFFLLVLLVGQLIGVFISLLFGQDIVVGTSAGIYALIGAYFYIAKKRSLYLPAGLVLSNSSWLGFLLFNLMLLIFFRNVSFTAHLGGFIMGFLLARFYLQKDYVDKKDPLLSIKAKQALVPLSILCLLLGVQYGLYLFDSTRAKQANIQVLKSILNRGTARFSELNLFAWNIAIDNNVDRGLLDIAFEAIQEAIDSPNVKAEELNNLIDTRASIYFRQGEIGKALVDELSLYSKSSEYERKVFYVSQMQRFLKKILASREVVLLDRGELRFENNKKSKNCLIFSFGNSSEETIRVKNSFSCQLDMGKKIKEGSKLLVVVNTANMDNEFSENYSLDSRVLFYPY